MRKHRQVVEKAARASACSCSKPQEKRKKREREGETGKNSQNLTCLTKSPVCLPEFIRQNRTLRKEEPIKANRNTRANPRCSGLSIRTSKKTNKKGEAEFRPEQPRVLSVRFSVPFLGPEPKTERTQAKNKKQKRTAFCPVLQENQPPEADPKQIDQFQTRKQKPFPNKT